jgi:hypothetical protein
MTIVAFFDVASLATLPGRTMEPAVMDRHGAVRSGSVTLYESNPLIEVDAVVHKNLLPDVVCDLGYGIAPGTVIDEGAVPLPDYHVLWPGKPTTNTVWTAVEDYTWFEAFSEEGCATGISCTPALHMQSERKTEDGRRKER